MEGEDPPDRGARLVEVRAHTILGLREKEVPVGYGC